MECPSQFIPLKFSLKAAYSLYHLNPLTYLNRFSLFSNIFLLFYYLLCHIRDFNSENFFFSKKTKSMKIKQKQKHLSYSMNYDH